MDEERLHRKLTAVEVIFMVLCAFALFCYLLLPLRSSKELSKRCVCAANLKSIANGFETYATANDEFWPIPTHMPAEQDEVGRVRYAPGKIGLGRGTQGQPDAGKSTEHDSALSTTRAFWELVRNGTASPKSFICPSSTDWYNDDASPQDFWDFRKYSEVSYGYQVPFGNRGLPSKNVDLEMVLIADQGPYSDALENGKRNPGMPQLTAGAPPDKWKRWNSPNHEGEGQNVIEVTGYVEFVQTPLAGWKKDNIYTRWSQPDADKDENELARIQGTPPTGIETPWGDTDSLIYP